MSAPNGNGGYSTAYRAYFVLILLLTYTLNFIDRYVMSILLPSIKEEFALADWRLGILVGTAFAMFYSAMGLPIARWADSGHRVKLISLAISIWSVTAAAGGIAANYTQLLLARIGVAIGEAGCTPPSHSLIGDLFSARRRATAIAVYSLGPVFGISLALALGGVLVVQYGWRLTLIIIGLPGLLLAVLVRLTLREPPRGMAEGREAAETAPSILETARFLWSRRTYRHMGTAIMLIATASYGAQSWMPSFLARSYGFDAPTIGYWLSIGTFASQTIGGLGGAFLSEHLGRRNPCWLLWTPSLVMFATVPVTLLGLFSSSMPMLAIGLFALLIASIVYNAPTYALGLQLVGLRMRAMVSAFTLLLVSVVGLGIGPLAVGALSDLLQPRFGQDSLRYALLLPVALVIWSASHYYLAGRTTAEDIARAPG